MSAQEQLGLRFGGYAGVNSLVLNPANGLTSSFTWDVNLVAAGVFAETNYGFIYNTHVPEIIDLSPEYAIDSDFTSESQFPANTLIVGYRDNGRDKFASALTTVMGPSFMVNLPSGQSFGLFSRLRTAVSAQRIPAVLNYYDFDRMPFGQEFSIKPFQVSAMVWSEIGANYARRFATSRGYLDIGGSVKFLQGYEAFYFDNKRTFGLTQFPGDSLSFATPHFEYGLTTSQTSGEYNGVKRNGSGIGIDLGVVYTIDEYDEGYTLKLGASLIDIGRINFDRNAMRHDIRVEGIEGLNPNDFKDFDETQEYIELLSDRLLGDAVASSNGNRFAIWLPGAISLQADYRVTNHVYVAAALVQRLPYQQPAIKRGNLFAIAPRFQHRWVELSTPVVLHNWREARLGASLRLAFITIGSDNNGSFLRRSDFNGTDLYVAVKVNPFKLGLNLGGGGGRGRSKGVKCYEF